MKFVIIAPARSGSTLLREMLNDHPQICCSGEVFGAKRVRGLSRHALHPIEDDAAFIKRRRDPLRFLERHVFASERPVAGFKVLYSQLFAFEFIPVLRDMMSAPDLRVVHLWRRDMIARHVSESRLRLKARMRDPSPVRGDFLARAFKPGAVELACEANLAARDCVRKLLDGVPTLDLAYEDFVDQHAAQSARLCEFLGVDPAAWPPLKEKKAGPPDEAVQALREVARLEAYFDHP